MQNTNSHSIRRGYRAFSQAEQYEATNAAVKRKFGETLKTKNRIAQVNELLAKVMAYNLSVVNVVCV